jgi:uncharacterized membrane protein
MKTVLERLRSPITCTAIVTQVITILLLTHTITPDMSDIIRGVVASVLQTGTLVGILNNPTDKESF